MSGTSMDAIDVVLVRFDADNTPAVAASASVDWPRDLRGRLQAAARGRRLDATEFARLDTELGNLFADAVLHTLQASEFSAAQVSAIGCHGQTLAHAPEGPWPATLQLGNGHVIAERTGITTVSDFRRRDIAAGGQGAPLAPAFHDAFLRDTSEHRVVLNLGGIANVTMLPADPASPATGFDTGPANCLMDHWISVRRDQAHDAGGRWAASAQPDPDLLAHLLSDPYFDYPPPKSTGTQYFSPVWLEQRLRDFTHLQAAVVQATLLQLSSHTVATAIARHAPDTARILVCGGGARNDRLLEELRTDSGLPVESTARYGLDPDWMEAIAFAWLAQKALSGLTGNLPSVTGARGERILGVVHPR